jgi:hypothetical protein
MPVLDYIPIKKKKKTPKGWSTPAIPAPRYQPPLIPSENPVPPRLARKLRNLGWKYRVVKGAEEIALCVSTAVMLLTLQMFLDWMVILSLPERALILAADIGLLVFFARKRLLPLILRPLNLEACALMVEKKWPRLRGRIIASVQLGAPRFTADSSELVRTVQQETDSKTFMLNFGEIVPARPLARRAGMALIVTMLCLGEMVATAPGSVALLERAFLLPAKVPRKTEVVCLSGNQVIPAGNSVLIEARARGIVPFHGRVTLVDDTGRIQEITIDPEKGRSDYFSLEIEKVENSFSYTIRLNDGVSDTYQVKMVPRPNIISLDCEQIYPAYTGLAPVKRTVGNLALLAGSELKIHATTNGKITKALLKLEGIGKVIPLTIGGSDNTDLTGKFDIPASGLTGFSIQITNQAGISSGDETQYRIDLIPDRPPMIQLTYPERLQELATIKAKPTIAFVASDDYGLAKVFLCYRIIQDQDQVSANTDDTGTAPPPPPPKKIEMDLGGKLPLTMKNRYTLVLANIKPPLVEETVIEYWMEARDANDITGPGISDSEHHTIKIVSDLEKKVEINSRLMESLSALTDVSQHQETINQDLGAVIQGKPEKNSP